MFVGEEYFVVLRTCNVIDPRMSTLKLFLREPKIKRRTKKNNLSYFKMSKNTFVNLVRDLISGVVQLRRIYINM